MYVLIILLTQSSFGKKVAIVFEMYVLIILHSQNIQKNLLNFAPNISIIYFEDGESNCKLVPS